MYRAWTAAKAKATDGTLELINDAEQSAQFITTALSWGLSEKHKLIS